MGTSKLAKFSIFIVVLLLVISQEAECRRKILKGRRGITRTYYRESAIPAWAIVTLVGLAELVIGGILFLILKFFVLDQAKPNQYIRPLVARPNSP